jgi:hypothetical protein
LAERRPRPPFWHRSRLGWANGLGFALTLFLGLWLLLALVSTVLPGADPVRFSLPTVYVAACLLTQLAVVVLGAVIVFRFMWSGADLSAHGPRLTIFLWSCAGLLFHLCQVVVLFRFDAPRLPNVARWASDFYWHAAPVGLVAFAIMFYANVEIPPAADDRD